jgi:uncharacterized protein
MNTDFYYGRGLTAPLQLDGGAGFRESAGVDKVHESIRIILGTQYGERVMRPEFGCNLKSLVFAPINQGTINLARYYVQEGLGRWEPRIELVDVSVVPDNLEGRLLINIQYRLREAQGVQSLIYPFYLEQS